MNYFPILIFFFLSISLAFQPYKILSPSTLTNKKLNIYKISTRNKFRNDFTLTTSTLYSSLPSTSTSSSETTSNSSLSPSSSQISQLSTQYQSSSYQLLKSSNKNLKFTNFILIVLLFLSIIKNPNFNNVNILNLNFDSNIIYNLYNDYINLFKLYINNIINIIKLKKYGIKNLILWLFFFFLTSFLHCNETALTKISLWQIDQIIVNEGKNSIFYLLSSQKYNDNNNINIINNNSNILKKKQKNYLTNLVTTILLCTTGLSIYSTGLFINFFLDFFPNLNLATVSLTLTVLTLLFGEILPKAIGIKYSIKMLRLSLKLLNLLYISLYPLVFIINKFSKFFLRLMFYFFTYSPTSSPSYSTSSSSTLPSSSSSNIIRSSPTSSSSFLLSLSSFLFRSKNKNSDDDKISSSNSLNDEIMMKNNVEKEDEMNNDNNGEIMENNENNVEEIDKKDLNDDNIDDIEDNLEVNIVNNEEYIEENNEEEDEDQLSTTTSSSYSLNEDYDEDYDEDDNITESLLRHFVDEAEKSKNIMKDESKMIKNVLDMQDKNVKSVMIPRVNIVGIPIEANSEKILSIIKESKYSRLPVYDEDMDSIEGVIFCKDVLDYVEEDENDLNNASFNSTSSFFPKKLLKDLTARDLMKSPYFIPEDMSCWNALQEMRRRRAHLAIIVDEYGGTSGIVTLEDLLEEVVGEIYDEDDEIIEVKTSERRRIFNEQKELKKKALEEEKANEKEREREKEKEKENLQKINNDDYSLSDFIQSFTKFIQNK